MMKNAMRKTILLILSLVLCVTAMTSCVDPDSDPSRPIKLKISFYKGGFGDAWLKAVAAEFEAVHTDVKVVLEGKSDMDGINRDRLNMSTPPSQLGDIVSVINPVYFAEYVRNKKLVDLTDLYDEEVENGKTMNDYVDPDFLKFVTVDEKHYGIPWEGAVTGFVYNVKMFELYGWEVPETMGDFFNLCTEIKADTQGTVAPLVYAGAIGGYFINILYAWMSQYEGEEGTDEFFALENPEVYQKEGRLKAYQQMGKIMGDKTNILEGSKGFDHLGAQREFIQGKAAMTVGGTWIETEMKSYLKDVPGFEMALFPAPSVTDDKLDKNGNPIRTVSSGNCDLLAIAEASKNKEIAKEFLKFMNRQEMLNTYTLNTGGNARPFTYEKTDWSDTQLTKFAKSSIEIWQKADNIFPYSTASIYLEGQVSFFPAEQGQPAVYMQNASSLNDAAVRAQYLYTRDYTLAQNAFIKHNG
ncbi:MAG: extracellular solute-binding protein [Spirochaetaceae bacterium]|jgi:ABC-type glycerol-3-phosphate transport system substrate-binding protein|nr:extracellular solute-binding protein [Spirochaetaceae bacterium]